MVSKNHPEDPSEGGHGQKPARSGKQKPEWAGGLKQLYDSVVEEPIPDAFKDLLEKLDGEARPRSDGDETSGGAGKHQ